MRYFYTFLFYLALPVIFIRLWWRSRRLPAYRERWQERLGRYPFTLDGCLWVHAVSVGETIAAIPLIKALQSAYPGSPLLVTTMTPTGALRVKAALKDSVHHVYLPYDLPFAVDRFLNAMRPRLGMIMETELWPNLLAACHQRHLPICLINARLSERSAKGYQRIAALTRTMLQQINVIATQGLADARRFIELGAPQENVVVTGNIKFDLELPPHLIEHSQALHEQLGKDRFIWIAASTHQGEEEIALAAHKKLREKNPQALLILVPRHPDRFQAVAELCAQQFVTARRSLQESCTSTTAVYLGDTLGELLLLYSVADVALVGGSLIPRGGHNLLEPAALQKPILSGPHLFNFAEISELLMTAQALTVVKDVDSLVNALLLLAQDPEQRKQQGQRAWQVVMANRGALVKQMQLAVSLLSLP